MDKISAHFYIFLTILLGIYGQLVLKWQVTLAGSFPEGTSEKLSFILKLLLNPWVVSSLLAAFLGMLSWMAALSKAELSYAYPFTSLSFVLILVLSAALLHEPLTLTKVLGMVLIVAGIIIGSA